MRHGTCGGRDTPDTWSTEDTCRNGLVTLSPTPTAPGKGWICLGGVCISGSVCLVLSLLVLLLTTSGVLSVPYL